MNQKYYELLFQIPFLRISCQLKLFWFGLIQIFLFSESVPEFSFSAQQDFLFLPFIHPAQMVS